MTPGVSAGTTYGPASNGSPIAKYGPTVWEGVVAKIVISVGLLEGGLTGAAQVDVEVVGMGPVGPSGMDVKAGDHALARLLVTDRVEDRVVREERIARKVHLGDEPLREGAAEQREVDVGGTPGVVVVAPRIRTRLD